MKSCERYFRIARYLTAPFVNMPRTNEINEHLLLFSGQLLDRLDDFLKCYRHRLTLPSYQDMQDISRNLFPNKRDLVTLSLYIILYLGKSTKVSSDN